MRVGRKNFQDIEKTLKELDSTVSMPVHISYLGDRGDADDDDHGEIHGRGDSENHGRR